MKILPEPTVLIMRVFEISIGHSSRPLFPAFATDEFPNLGVINSAPHKEMRWVRTGRTLFGAKIRRRIALAFCSSLLLHLFLASFSANLILGFMRNYDAASGRVDIVTRS